jgi:hypothetical protein
MKGMASCGTLLFVFGLSLWSGPADAQTFITLDYPGGIDTQLNGIDGNNIVGSSSLPNGFLYNGSTFTEIADPLGVNATTPLGISGGTIVGTYNAATPSSGYNHGFLYNESTYTTIDDPLASTLSWGTTPLCISGENVVGGYGIVNGSGDDFSNGFLYNGSTYLTIDDPLAGNGYLQGTWARGIQGNEIVGSYRDPSGQYHGFLYNMQTGIYTTLDDPLSLGSYGTIATGISGNNIVGIYYTSLGGDYTAAHGFLYDGSTYTTFDDPLGIGNTYLEGISGNTAVGWYRDSSDLSEGFVVIVPEPSTLAVLAAAAIGLLGYAWQRRSQAARHASSVSNAGSGEGTDSPTLPESAAACRPLCYRDESRMASLILPPACSLMAVALLTALRPCYQPLPLPASSHGTILRRRSSIPGLLAHPPPP